MFPVFQKALRDSRRMMIWMSIALGLYATLMVSFYPAMKSREDEMNKMMEAYPKEMLAMFYGDTDTSTISFAEAAGFVQVEFATWMLLILGGIVIWQGFSAVTNSERDGTLDLMLSMPVSRRRYLLAQVSFTAVMLLTVLTASFAGLVLSTQLWPEFDLSVGALALGIYGAFLPLMVVACFTFWIVTIVPSSQKFVGGMMYLLFFGTYLVHGLSGASETFKGIRPYFLFNYYNARDLINEGADPSVLLGLTLAVLIFLSLAWWQVDRKELGV